MRDLGSRAFSVWVRVPSGAPKYLNPSLLRVGVGSDSPLMQQLIDKEHRYV